MRKGKIVIGLFALLLVSLVFIPYSSVLAAEQDSIIPEHSEEWQTLVGLPSLNNVYSVFVGDVDDDGVAEIVTGGYAYNGTLDHGQLRIWNWDGTTLTLEHSEEWPPIAYGTSVCSVFVADVDADGVKEIITGGDYHNGSHYNAQLRIWNWNATIQQLTLEHSEEWYTTGITLVMSVSLGDVDADGITEIVTGGMTGDWPSYYCQLRIWSFPDKTPPVADAGLNQAVTEDTVVTFNGSASWDYAKIVSYVWTFTDVTTQTLAGVTANYTFATPGVYTVTLNVTDVGGNWDTDTVVITVLEVTFPLWIAGVAVAAVVGVTIVVYFVKVRKP